MKPSLPEDIARLTGDAKFEFTAYQAFERPPRVPSGITPVVIAKEERPLPEGDSGQLLNLNKTIQETLGTGIVRAHAPTQRGSSVATWTAEPRATGASSFRALNALTRATGAPRSKIAKTTLALFTSSGGCGVTTITATLGRLLSGQDEPVLLADGAPQSLLAAHFGVRALRPGIRSIVSGAGAPRANLHIVTGSKSSSEDWLKEATETLEGEFERLIVDVSPDVSTTHLHWILKGAVGLVPLLPDMRTAYRMGTMLEGLQVLRSECGVLLPVYFVLSQFDANVRLHCEIRDWLRESYGDLLVPITLRRGDEVSEALADGTTVLDYAPNSGIA
ncbi:MAG: cellulose synthase operon protein YhjQ/BcsQ, partial [Bryobacteraceae bacterium]